MQTRLTIMLEPNWVSESVRSITSGRRVSVPVARLAPCAICICSEIAHQRKECRRLTNKKSHRSEKLHDARGNPPCLRWPNDRTRREFSTEEWARLRHDQICLEVLASEGRRIQVGKSHRDSCHRILRSQRRCIPSLILPGLKVHRLGWTDAD